MTTRDVEVTQEEFLQELVADLQRENSLLRQSLLIAQIKNRKLLEEPGDDEEEAPVLEEVPAEDA